MIWTDQSFPLFVETNPNSIDGQIRPSVDRKKNSPPREGFLVGWVPNEEPEGRRPPPFTTTPILFKIFLLLFIGGPVQPNSFPKRSIPGGCSCTDLNLCPTQADTRDFFLAKVFFSTRKVKSVIGVACRDAACAYPLPKSPLCSSIKMAFLVARISAQKDPCMHPFQKGHLRASVSQSH